MFLGFNLRYSAEIGAFLDADVLTPRGSRVRS